MSQMKNRTNTHEVHQTPKYDHVVWSASYQTSGGNRRYSDQELTVMMTSADSPRLNLKPSGTSRCRELSPSRSLHLSRSTSKKLTHWSNKMADSEKGRSRKQLTFKDSNANSHPTESASANTENVIHPGIKKWDQATAKQNLGHLRGCRTSEKNQQYTQQKRENIGIQYQPQGHCNSPLTNVTIIISDEDSKNSERFPALAPCSRSRPKFVPSRNQKRMLNSSRNCANSSRAFSERADISGVHSFNKTVPNYLEPGPGTSEFRPLSAPEDNVGSKSHENINTTRPSTSKQNQSNTYHLNLAEESSSSDCSDFDDFDDDSNLDDCFAHLTWRDKNSDSLTNHKTLDAKTREDNSKIKNCEEDPRGNNVEAALANRFRTPSICNRINSGVNRRPSFLMKRDSQLELGSKNGRRISSAPMSNYEIMRRKMQRRFSSESWYRKALKTLKGLPAFESRNKNNYTDDPDEINERLCRPTASSRAREAATGRATFDEMRSVEKSIKTPRHSVVVDVINIEDMKRFKGQKHVTNSDIKNIVQRLSTKDPKQGHTRSNGHLMRMKTKEKT